MNAAAVYQETAITTQSRGKLVVLLYNGAIQFLKNASTCIARGDIEGKNRCIAKARDIIFELNSSLDLHAGGDIAGNLRSLYNFMWVSLGRTNISNNADEVEGVIRILSDLRQSWQQVVV